MEDREAGKQKGRAPKLSDVTLKRYFKKYKTCLSKAYGRS
ncbi:MAG: hypothetical protein PWQ32_1456 [Thermococcaceae archaeon]|jgi:hypothetical protein|nr:hypothetical protein [Thermococcaceae archaeon]MDK2854385.1 hypothetical protein [Thermococcaceae archaeon]